MNGHEFVSDLGGMATPSVWDPREEQLLSFWHEDYENAEEITRIRWNQGQIAGEWRIPEASDRFQSDARLAREINDLVRKAKAAPEDERGSAIDSIKLKLRPFLLNRVAGLLDGQLFHWEKQAHISSDCEKSDSPKYSVAKEWVANDGLDGLRPKRPSTIVASTRTADVLGAYIFYNISLETSTSWGWKPLLETFSAERDGYFLNYLQHNLDTYAADIYEPQATMMALALQSSEDYTVERINTLFELLEPMFAKTALSAIKKRSRELDSDNPYWVDPLFQEEYVARVLDYVKENLFTQWIHGGDKRVQRFDVSICAGGRMWGSFASFAKHRIKMQAQTFGAPGHHEIPSSFESLDKMRDDDLQEQDNFTANDYPWIKRHGPKSKQDMNEQPDSAESPILGSSKYRFLAKRLAKETEKFFINAVSHSDTIQNRSNSASRAIRLLVTFLWFEYPEHGIVGAYLLMFDDVPQGWPQEASAIHRGTISSTSPDDIKHNFARCFTGQCTIRRYEDKTCSELCAYLNDCLKARYFSPLEYTQSLNEMLAGNNQDRILPIMAVSASKRHYPRDTFVGWINSVFKSEAIQKDYINLLRSMISESEELFDEIL